MKSVALVANSCWYIYNLRLGIIKALQSQHIKVSVIAPHDAFTDKLLQEKCTVFPVRLNCKGKTPVADASFGWQLFRLYKQQQFDYVFHYTIKPNIYGSIAAYCNGIPCTSIISGLGYSFMKKGGLEAVAKKMYYIANALAEEVWFVNADDKKRFEANQIVTYKKSKLLPGEGVDIHYFNRTITKKSVVTPTTHFLFSGRLIWSKGVAEYVKAARIIKQKYPSVKFSILGYLNVDNPDAIPPEALSRWQSQGTIEYLGFTEDVRPFLEAASCFVLPSYYGEGTPRSLLEAASMQVPIITTNHVGCREVVQDGYNGYLCRTKNVPDLVAKMETFLQLPEQDRIRMGDNGRKLAMERFDENFVIVHYLQKLEINPLPQPVLHAVHK